MTGKRSRDKGARYERKIATFLSTALGVPFERRIDQTRVGGDDLSHDFEAWLSLEAKDVAATSLGAWVDQAVASAGNRLAVVVHHRRGNGDPARDFATLELGDLAVIVERLAACDCPGPDPTVYRPTTKETQP